MQKKLDRYLDIEIDSSFDTFQVFRRIKVNVFNCIELVMLVRDLLLLMADNKESRITVSFDDILGMMPVSDKKYDRNALLECLCDAGIMRIDIKGARRKSFSCLSVDCEGNEPVKVGFNNVGEDIGSVASIYSECCSYMDMNCIGTGMIDEVLGGISSEHLIRYVLDNRLDKEEKEVRAPEVLSEGDRVLDENETMEVFDRLLSEAEKEVDINAPWLSREVVFNRLPLFSKLLEKGVTVKISYGYHRGKGKGQNETDKVAEVLKGAYGHYRNFIMQATDSHSKIALFDNQRFLLGSFNFLSRHKNDRCGERSVLSSNQGMLDSLRSECFAFC